MMRDDYLVGEKIKGIAGIDEGRTFTIISECYPCSLNHLQYDVVNDETGGVSWIDSQDFDDYYEYLG